MTLTFLDFLNPITNTQRLISYFNTPYNQLLPQVINEQYGTSSNPTPATSITSDLKQIGTLAIVGIGLIVALKVLK